MPLLLHFKMRITIAVLVFMICFLSCEMSDQVPQTNIETTITTPIITVLGIAQDAGYPQINCNKNCCKKVWASSRKKEALPRHSEKVSCLGIIDPKAKKYWLIDATPDIKFQLQQLKDMMPEGELGGILLTHAHMGHYTGLMELGREAWGSKNIAVYAMPRMQDFLRNNGPWSQLVNLENINLRSLQADSSFALTDQISIRPFFVPHRDEFSETVGYKISGPEKSGIFIPDIDKWEKWNRNINELVKANDIAFLDGTFYQSDELPGRNMNEIPHPFVVESIEYFKTLSSADKSKIYFIHFNHTNPLLWSEKARSQVEQLNFNLATDAFTFSI